MYNATMRCVSVIFVLIVGAIAYGIPGPYISTTKVTPLTWSSANLRSQAVISCTAMPPAFPIGSSVTYTWSGTGLTFSSPSSASTTATATAPGTYSISCSIHIVYPSPPGGTYDWAGTATSYVFGGPMTIETTRDLQPREGRTGQTTRFQPLILEDYSGGSQGQSSLSATAAGNQPGTAVSYSWSKNGTLAFTTSTSQQTAGITASGSCGRSGSYPIVTYTITIDGANYSTTDSTDPQYKAVSCHRPMYCNYLDSDTQTTSSQNPPEYTYLKTYYLYIKSNIGDPLKYVFFQERYPGPYYYFLGQQEQGTAPYLGIPDWASWNKTTSQWWTGGMASGVDVTPGYDYHAKAPDTNGAVWTQFVDNPGLEVYQFIYAATTSWITGSSGILTDSFQINMWSTGVTRE